MLTRKVLLILMLASSLFIPLTTHAQGADIPEDAATDAFYVS